MKRPVVIALSAVVAVISSFSLWGMANSRQGTVTQTVPIVVVKHAVPLHSKLTGQDVTIVQVPISVAPQTGIHKISDVIGKFTTNDLEKGEYLFPVDLTTTRYRNGVKEGHVLVGIPVDGTTSSGDLHVGDTVDLVAVEGGQGTGNRSGQLLYKGIRVVRVVNQQGQDVSADSSQTQTNVPAPTSTVPAVVTVEATPEQALQIAIAEKNGSIVLLVDPFARTES